MTMDPLRDPAIALRYRCDFCGADPGENCHDNMRDIVLELPHYSRTPQGAAFIPKR